MCQRVDCPNCQKATWQGCGMHVRCALFGVALDDRCPNWKQGVTNPCSNTGTGSTAGTTTNESEE